jgi:acyl-CoA hydrolase
MKKAVEKDWEKKVVTPTKVFENIEPGMSIFLGTGVGEPRTLVKHLMASNAANLKDLELIQLVSLGDAISLKALDTHTYRLKTFFSGWVASEAITAGRVDLIPRRPVEYPLMSHLSRLRLPIKPAIAVSEWLWMSSVKPWRRPQ